MNATTAKRTPRKLSSKQTKNDDLATLTPWVRKLELLARPLRGKLTKAINQK